MLTEEKEEECPRCEMNRIMIGMSIAHVACGTIKEDGERGKCNEWAAGIDPKKMSAEEIMEEVYSRAGLNGIALFPELYNNMLKSFIIKKVGEKMEKHEPVDEEEMKLYKRYIKEEVEKGL